MPLSPPLMSPAAIRHHALSPSCFGGGTPSHPTAPIQRCNNLRPTLPDPPPPPLDPQTPSLLLLLSPAFDFLLPTSPQSPTLLFPSATLHPHLPTLNPSSSYLLGLHPTSKLPIHALVLPPTQPSLPSIPNAHFKPLRSLPHLLPPLDLNLAAHARSLAEFHLRHRFCGLCAAPTLPDHNGARRRCSKNSRRDEPHHITHISLASYTKQHNSCPGVWFPRIDPVAIMLVVRSDGHCLLARQPRFPNALYSCLAGFMEHAEGIDDAVRREVAEEVGIVITTVRFFGSQPWPFPYSLMLACVAKAESHRIVPDPREIEHADWFTQHRVKQMLHGTDEDGLVVPPATAIAGEMCAAFARGDPITRFDHSDQSGRL